MGIAKYKPLVRTPAMSLNTIESKASTSIVIDNEFIPVTSITQYVSGYEWTVDYYSQVLTNTTDLREHDHAQLSIYQQYVKINKFTFKVINALTDSQDQITNEFIVVGSATVPPYIVPNAGDMFEADLGRGKIGIFRVFRVDNKSIQLESVYDIEYSLVFYKEENPTRYQDLATKVVREYHYYKEFVNSDQNPMLIKNDYKLISDLKNHYDTLLDTYLNLFLSNQFSTLIVPLQTTPVYDKYLTTFFLNIVEVFEHPLIKKIKILNTDKDPYLEKNTILDIIINRDNSLLKKAIKFCGLVSTKAFNKIPILDGIRFSGIPLLVYPDSNKEDIARNFVIPKTITNELTITSTVSEYTYPVHKSGYYILSENYYNQTESQSYLERQVFNLVTGRSIDIQKLTEIINDTDNFNELELFYYGPIILTLIKTAVRAYE